MTEREVAIPSCIANEDAREESNAQPSRTRESLAPGADEPNFVTVRNRHRGKRGPQPHEGDGTPRKPGRSLVSEDYPSPRCVWEDYRAFVAHHGEGAPGVALVCWLIAAPPFAAHMLAAVQHVATQRPARFWACVLFGVILLAIVKIH